MTLKRDGDRRGPGLPPVLATLQAETLDSAVFDIDRYVDQLAAMGHPTRFAVLYALGRDGELPTKGLEEHTGCDGNNRQTHLDVLEDRGLVRKRRDSEDERRRLHRLTDSGATLTDAVVSKMETDATAAENRMPMADRY
jgi:DNA-binding MarR family transcriptional regulator